MIKFLFVGIAVLLSVLGYELGLSTYTPWINQPSHAHTTPKEIYLGTGVSDSNTENYSIIVAVTMSGGGTRAAAFAYGVLEGLNEAKIDWHMRQTNLLQEIDLLSGVSAGSILATYMTAFGSKALARFKDDFLYKDFQSQLITSAFDPTNLSRLFSSNYGRGNLLVDNLNELFKGKTYSDLPPRPKLLVTATDLSKASSFQFTAEQFSLICSDLTTVPLAFAVGASSSVPFIFSPITVKNYSKTDHCKDVATINSEENELTDFRIRQLYREKLTYLNSKDRPYIHLVDGAVSDNLGLRSIIDRAAAVGDVGALVSSAPKNSVQRMIIIVINAEIDPLENIDQSVETPDMIKVASAIRFSKGLSDSAETLSILHESAQTWSEQMRDAQLNMQGSVFTPESQLHVVQVNLRDIPDPVIRQRLKALPTVFNLPRSDVDDLIVAGRETLRASPAFQKLMASFRE